MNEVKIHPFEKAGMGTGPYKFVGIATIPSPHLASHNPDAYNAALRQLPKHLVGGCGTCQNCGMAITVICIVKDSEGRSYGVGSDCVDKTGDKALGDPAKVAVARRRNQMRREAREQARQVAHEKWLDTVCNEAGETNRQRLDREAAERKALEDSRKVREQTAAELLAPLALLLSDGRLGFRDSVAAEMERGQVPCGRGREIAIDILARYAGRRNSKAFRAEVDRLDAIFDKAELILKGDAS